MNKKIYVAPSAELIAFAPTDDIAANWIWDWELKAPQTASVMGNVQIFEDAESAWNYNGADKPY